MLTVLAAILGFIARFIAAIIAILFVFITVLVLLFFNVESTLFKSETYKHALATNNVYNQFPALAADELTKMKSFLANPCAENPLGCAIDGASPELQACLTEVLGQEDYEAIGTGQRNPNADELHNSQSCLDKYGVAQAPQQVSGGEQMAFMNSLTPEDWRALLTILLPPVDLQHMSENTLDQVFTYLNGEADSARVSLAQMKKHLTGQAGQEALTLLLSAQPPCTQEQLAQMTAGVISGKGDMVLCAPAKEELALILPVMQEQLSTLIDRIPDEAVIIKPPTPSDTARGGGPLGNDPPTALRRIHLALRLSPLLPVGLLLLVTLFAVRSLKGWLRWWGIPMLIAGLIAFGIAITALARFDWVWSTFVAVRIPPLLAASIADVSRKLAFSVAQELMKWIMLEAGAIGLLGLTAILGSFIYHPTARTLPPAPGAGPNRIPA